MIRPPFEVETKGVKLPGDPYGYDYDEVLWSYWLDAAGRTKGFATNWQKRPASIRLVGKDGCANKLLLEPLQTIEF